MNKMQTNPVLHPERVSEEVLVSADGRLIFESIFAVLKNKTFVLA